MTNNIIIVDIETNVFDGQEEHFDVIQIGAYKVSGLSIGDKFNMYVKPTKNLVLTDFIKNLTKITQEQVDTAQTFPEVWKKFIAFCGKFNILMSWGAYDRIVLKRVCKHFNLNFHFQEHLNLKNFARYALELRKGKRGLKSVIQDLYLPYDANSHHNALYDVELTFSVYKFLIYQRIITSFYQRTYWVNNGKYFAEKPEIYDRKVRINPSLLKLRNDYLKKAEQLDEYFKNTEIDEYTPSKF